MMPNAESSVELLEWLLLLLIATTLSFAWRCHRAGVFAAFGHEVPQACALLRLGTACALPALLGAIWLWLAPALSMWAELGLLHLLTSWYGLRWLLPDGLAGARRQHSR